MIEYTTTKGEVLQLYNFMELSKEVQDKLVVREKIDSLETSQYEYRKNISSNFEDYLDTLSVLAPVFEEFDCGICEWDWFVNWIDFNFVDTVVDWATVSFRLGNILALLDTDEAYRLRKKYQYVSSSYALGVEVKYVAGSNAPIYDIIDRDNYETPHKNELITEYLNLLHSKTPELVNALNRSLRDYLNKLTDTIDASVLMTDDFKSLDEFKNSQDGELYLADGRKINSIKGSIYWEVSPHHFESI